MSEHEKQKAKGQHIPCKDIHDLLFDYMSRELGDARSLLVREHLRKCEECSRHAAEIQSTLDVLNQSGREAPSMPSRLSDDRRKKLYWWYSHPFMRWIENHHVLFSISVSLLIIIIVLLVMLKVKLWQPHPPEDIYPIWIGNRLTGTTNIVVFPDETMQNKITE